jgi:hypothetical protein
VEFFHDSFRSLLTAYGVEHVSTPFVEPHFIEFEFGRTGWGVVCDYSEELWGVIAPILRPYLPSSFVTTDAGPTSAVSSVNSHTG